MASHRVNGKFVSEQEWLDLKLKEAGKYRLSELIALLIQSQRDRQAELYRWMARDLDLGDDIKDSAWYATSLALAKRRQEILQAVFTELSNA